MSSVIKQMKNKLTISRKLVILILILSFLGFIMYSAIGGSVTNQFDQSESAPEFQDSPESRNLPNSREGGFNYSDFDNPPEGFNPPASAIGDLIGGGNGGSAGGTGDVPSIEPPESDDDDSGGGGVQLPPGDPSDDDDNNNNPSDDDDPSGPVNEPDPGDFEPSNQTNGQNNSRKAINIPDQPNKARNLYNLSTIELFPNSNSSVSISINFPQPPRVNFNNLFFLVLILSILYLPKSIVTRLIHETKDASTSSDKEDSASPFFKPEKSAVEIRREKERKRRLENFADHIQAIIEDIRVQLNEGITPKEIITEAYLSLDEAFASFMDLKRDKSATPLEHAQERFEEHEIDNKSLNQLVDLFYRSRFGNKELQKTHVDQFIDGLENLVLNEAGTETEATSRWSIFR